MKRRSPSPRSSPAVTDWIRCGAKPAAGSPALGEVAFEIGLVLALHLAAAFAVVASLGAFGIV